MHKSNYVLYGFEGCPYCTNAKALLKGLNIVFKYKDIKLEPKYLEEFKNAGHKTSPQIYNPNNQLIGGFEDLQKFFGVKMVTKRDGSMELFNADKLNRWAEYAAQEGGSWSEIAQETFKRISGNPTTIEIHETMINVCLYKEDINYSRIASRLEYAKIRKNMIHSFGITDKDTFEEIFNAMVDNGYWDKEILPPFNPKWELWYLELFKTYLEYWQVRQWSDKYSLRHKSSDKPIETPHIGVLALALSIHGDTDKAFNFAKNVIQGKINMPTPVLNGCRNGDFNTISCCVIRAEDTVQSIGVGTHISFEMTAKKAGIGITFDTRSKGSPVKNGRVKHLGKHGIYQTTDRAVKMFTQVSRGGSATMTYTAIDPQIEEMLLWKTQRVDIEERIDKLDYSFAYNNAFLEAVIQDKAWYLFDYHEANTAWQLFYDPATTLEDYKILASNVKHTEIKARDLLKIFLTARQETGRVYCINVSRTNEHTPFLDTIVQSNLCQEIALPTKAYKDMFDLYATKKSEGETAFCSLAAINAMKVSESEYEEVSALALETVDILIDLAPMLTPSMEESVRRRRSVGIGITGLAGWLYNQGLDYDGSEESYKQVSKLAEMHYYYLIKASQRLAIGKDAVEGINLEWLPVDTRKNTLPLHFNWEELRGVPRRNSVLVAHMPTESSAVFSNAPNGLYPIRSKVINKASRKGAIQYIAPEGDYMYAWSVQNNHLAQYYSFMQDFSDQAISADYYTDFTKYPDGKVPLSQLMKEWVVQAKLGNKTMYYVNTNDSNGGSIQDILANKVEEEEDCSGCKI